VAAVALAPLADAAALRDYCRVHLEKNGSPEIFQILPEIPKTISEKPIERACIEALRAASLI
jgi:crotonobetaine/carnitine-CoA ligase